MFKSLSFLSTATTSFVVLIACLALCCHHCTGRKNRDVFHGHRGILSPYEAGPLSLSLNKGDEKVLESGKPIMKQNQSSGDDLGGGAICVQDVAAPKVRYFLLLYGKKKILISPTSYLHCIKIKQYSLRVCIPPS